MRIFATADLHWPHHKGAVKRLAERVKETEPDVLVIAGDIAHGIRDDYDECLREFASFTGPKLAVAGNSDLWAYSDFENSAIKYTHLGKILDDNGFHYLDKSPIVVENGGKNVGFAGNIGWYDFSFRDRKERTTFLILGEKAREVKRLSDMDPEDYEHKKMSIANDLVQEETQIDDKKYINWKYTDKDFTSRVCIPKLEKHLSQLQRDRSVRDIVAVTHTVPFKDLLRDSKSGHGKVRRAFAGSEDLGKTLKGNSKLRAAISGHTHNPVSLPQLGRYNVGGYNPRSQEIHYQIVEI